MLISKMFYVWRYSLPYEIKYKISRKFLNIFSKLFYSQAVKRRRNMIQYNAMQCSAVIVLA